MAKITRPTGVEISVPDGIVVAAPRSRAQPTARRGKGPRPPGPAPIATGGQIDDPLVQSLTAQEITLVDAVDLRPSPAVSTRRGSSTAKRAELAVDVGDREDAVVLLEQDGVYSWHLPDRARGAAPPAAQGGRRGAAARRRVVIPIPIVPRTAAKLPRGTKTRGVLLDMVIGPVRAYVLKFAASVAVGQAVRFLERTTDPGVVRITGIDPATWARSADLGQPKLPSDRPARVLLLLHGTFSSTVGSFGVLGATPWGREALKAILNDYDLVVGYDHRTLSEDPLANATAFLDILQRVTWPMPPRLDAIAFSRGGLVLRSLIEYLLPASNWGAKADRAVFVGCTNGGTLLASPPNWDMLVDLYTNLAVTGANAVSLFAPGLGPTVVAESVRSIGALVKYLARAAVTDGGAPGLAAMDPEGAFIKGINGTQPGQPGPGDVYCCVVTSDFKFDPRNGLPPPKEMAAGFARWIADGIVDRLMSATNDLVVNTESMSAIDPGVGAFVSARHDFGQNGIVYHTNYFTRPEVAQAISQWLALRAPGTRGPVRPLPPPVGTAPRTLTETDIAIVPGDMPVHKVRSLLTADPSSYVVVQRDPARHSRGYAYGPDELLGALEDAEDDDDDRPIAGFLEVRGEDELGMHESTESPTVPASNPGGPFITNRGVTGRRRVVVGGDRTIGVIPGAGDLRDTASLAGLVPKIVAPASPADRGVRRQLLPTFALKNTLRASPGMPQPALRAGPKRGGARGAGPKRAVKAAGAATPSPSGTATCEIRATMDDVIPVDAVRTVEVTISRQVLEAVPGPGTAKGRAKVDLATKLILQAVGKKNIEVTSEPRVEINPPASDAAAQVYFDIRGTTEGAGELWVVARQGSLPLLTLTLRPTVGPANAKAGGRVMHGEAVAEPPPAEPVPVLQIFERQDGNKVWYEFNFTLKGDGGIRTFQSKPLKSDRLAFVSETYKRIEDRWVACNEDSDAFAEELRDLGGMLWSELLPPDLQDFLWRMKDEIGSIIVVSEEPFIPWELLHFKPPDTAAGPSRLPKETLFFGQLGLTRWLHNVPWPPTEIPIRRGRVYHLVPEYAGEWLLEETKAEGDFVAKTFGSQPLECTPKAVRDLLSRAGCFDLFHFAGHGFADGSRISESRIMVGGRVDDGQFAPLYVDSLAVAQNGRFSDGTPNRPLVMLNACQAGRAGWQLTSIGGFAKAFLAAGAGAFVSSLWAVGDSPAKFFTKALYTALQGGARLSPAVRKAREAAREKDATWLAYVVYGHPKMQLKNKAKRRG